MHIRSNQYCTPIHNFSHSQSAANSYKQSIHPINPNTISTSPPRVPPSSNQASTSTMTDPSDKTISTNAVYTILGLFILGFVMVCVLPEPGIRFFDWIRKRMRPQQRSQQSSQQTPQDPPASRHSQDPPQNPLATQNSPNTPVVSVPTAPAPAHTRSPPHTYRHLPSSTPGPAPGVPLPPTPPGARNLRGQHSGSGTAGQHSSPPSKEEGGEAKLARSEGGVLRK
ncbi:hypothetical protein BDW02DRAFT_573579 [Decorospora gaudefroyi]|uniref:Transmembrane protein n=1 Tax=Decorospora gaudefroyi TaxID=184978 RepID=A0A6A5JZT9_9PLEO|nr:hypothetical protein BDW02DRAFT_573579 [Decorospora gaudefroyi]